MSCKWSYQGYGEFTSGCGISTINWEDNPAEDKTRKFCEFCGNQIEYENLCETCEHYKNGDCEEFIPTPSFWCDDWKDKVKEQNEPTTRNAEGI